MADKIQPVFKDVPKPSGLASPSGYSTLSTPEPCYGRLFGSGMPAKDVNGMGSMMGKDNKKMKTK